MTTLLKLGVDNGNYNTKSSDGMLYASGYVKSPKEFITSDMQVEYQGAFYAVGGQRMKLQQEKTKAPDTFILTLPAIANCMKKAGVTSADISLGVGLPIDIYGAQKADFQRYFLQNPVHFRFEGIAYACRIVECKVFPQEYAALCRYYPRLKEYRSLTLVDIGGYTVDVMALHDFTPDKQSCTSIRRGTILLYNAIRDKLQQDNIILTDSQITDAIQGRVEHLQAEHIRQVLSSEVTAYIQELLNALREYGRDLALPTVFAGGGAELLEGHFRKESINMVALLNRFSNAEGYLTLLR